MAYDIFVKKEKLCNGKMMRLLFTYSLFVVSIIVMAAIVLIADAYLKVLHAHKDLV